MLKQENVKSENICDSVKDNTLWYITGVTYTCTQLCSNEIPDHNHIRTHLDGRYTVVEYTLWR